MKARRARILRTALGIGLFLVLVALAWEAFKFLGGDPWRLEGIGFFHDPPFRVPQVTPGGN